MTIPTKLQDIIIRAALESLEQHGMEGLTVRKIAAKAGVNVAAINYHFRSKEKLLEQVFDLASTNAFGDIDQLITAKSGKKLEQQLETFLLHYANGLIEYPNVSRVLIHQLINPDESNSIITQRLEVFLQSLTGHFARLQQKDASDLKVRQKTIEFISVMINLCLIPEVFRKSLGFDIQNPETRAKLIASFVRDKI